MDKIASLSAKSGRTGRRVGGAATDDELWSEQHQTAQPGGGPGRHRAPDGKGVAKTGSSCHDQSNRNCGNGAFFSTSDVFL